MIPYTEPTAEQIAEAQAAGDAAYAEAEKNGTRGTGYDAYRAAYNTTRDEQDRRAMMAQNITGTVEVDSRIPPIDERIADVTPLCDAAMEKWHEYLAGMSDDEIALMNEMTRETAHDDTKDDAMGRLW